MRRAIGIALRSALLAALLLGLPIACAVRDTVPTDTEYASPDTNSTSAGVNAASPDANSTSAGVDAASPEADSAPAAATGQAGAGAENGSGTPGEVLFLACAGCHSLDPGDTLFVGPHLAGIVGREAAALADYSYSAALAEASFTWGRSVLFSWIAATENLLPGTHMLYHNHLEPDEVFRLIDFLERNGRMQASEQ